MTNYKKMGEKEAEFIPFNYKIRDIINNASDFLPWNAYQECLEDTYSQYLHARGIHTKLKYRIILYLIYKLN